MLIKLTHKQLYETNMPQNDDKFLLILEKLTDISERTARIEVEQQYIKADLEEVKKQDAIQNQHLAEHIANSKAAHARLDLNAQLLEDYGTRIKTLEEPSKFLSLLKKYSIYVAGLGAAIMTIYKWFHKG